MYFNSPTEQHVLNAQCTNLLNSNGQSHTHVHSYETVDIHEHTTEADTVFHSEIRAARLLNKVQKFRGQTGEKEKIKKTHIYCIVCQTKIMQR